MASISASRLRLRVHSSTAHAYSTIGERARSPTATMLSRTEPPPASGARTYSSPGPGSRPISCSAVSSDWFPTAMRSRRSRSRPRKARSMRSRRLAAVPANAKRNPKTPSNPPMTTRIQMRDRSPSAMPAATNDTRIPTQRRHGQPRLAATSRSRSSTRQRGRWRPRLRISRSRIAAAPPAAHAITTRKPASCRVVQLGCRKDHGGGISSAGRWPRSRGPSRLRLPTCSVIRRQPPLSVCR